MDVGDDENNINEPSFNSSTGDGIGIVQDPLTDINAQGLNATKGDGSNNDDLVSNASNKNHMEMDLRANLTRLSNEDKDNDGIVMVINGNNDNSTRGEALLLMATQNGNVTEREFPLMPHLGKPLGTQTVCSVIASPITNTESESTVSPVTLTGVSSPVEGESISSGQ